MKQNIVFKIQIPNKKSISKVLTIVGGKDGVTSVKIFGEEKDKVAVIGDDIDIAALKTSLEKKVGHTTIVSVTVLNGNDNDEDNRYEERQRNNYYYQPYVPYHQPYPY